MFYNTQVTETPNKTEIATNLQQSAVNALRYAATTAWLNSRPSGEGKLAYQKLIDLGLTDVEILYGAVAIITPFIRDAMEVMRTGRMPDAPTVPPSLRNTETGELKTAAEIMIKEIANTVNILIEFVRTAGADGMLLEPTTGEQNDTETA